MSEIALLDNSTIDKIAAGEVVENPASVVKELVENAMDSGATAITVEIKNGGIEFIRVTDNGKGISYEDVPLAFLRHATSKISSVNDLLKVSSMGFRGEALASISSVSKVELITKTKESLMGTRYVIEGSKVIDYEEIGAPTGTSVIVRNLFFNTPARRKFLKSETSEGNYISEIMQNLALGRPDISFSFIVNGKAKLSTSGNNDLKEIIYRLYGRDLIKEILPIEYEKDGIVIKGYLGEPSLNRSSRSYETFFINSRYIKSKIISAGIEDGYKEYTMQHKFPFCVLHFSLDSTDIDVNVHPSKKEIRFHRADELSRLISFVISSKLSEHEMIARVSLENKKEKAPEAIINPEPFESRDNKAVEKNEINNEAIDNGYIENLFDDITEEDDNTKSEVSNNNAALNIKRDTITKSFIFEEEPAITDDLKFEDQNKAKENLLDSIVISNPSQMELFENEKFLSENSVKDYRIVGQLFNTYWIIEFKDKIYFVDQHAAHEKVNYEKLMKRVKLGQVDSQYLNPAVIISLSPKDKNILDNNIEYFNKLGFEIEDMGLNEIGLRATPLELYFNSPKEMFINILGELANYPASNNPETITQRVATMACKASVKGGMAMNRQEIESLLDELLTLDNPYHCPHGRPTLFSMSKYELEKKFKRVVD